MAIFCTKCGTSNEDGADFCDNCGAKLRAPLTGNPAVGMPTVRPAGIPPVATTQVKSSMANPKKVIYAVSAATAVLLIGGGAMYFMLLPPAATASTLIGAAKAGYGKETTDRFKRELCLSNIDYSKSTFNAAENDQRTQAWLNALVAAGLYSLPVAINSAGFYAQTLLRYTATPELEKYRSGSSLCIAKDVEVADVVDISKPQEESLGRNKGSLKVLAVKAKLVLKSLNTASWMEKPEVRDAVMVSIDGWEYKDRTLQKQITAGFGLKDNKWITADAYLEAMEKQNKNARRGNSRDIDENSTESPKNSGGGFAAKLSGLFTFGNPLKGTWRTAAQDTGFGGKIPAGTVPELTFTSDSMESMGQSTKVDFSVDGKRVKVTPKGQSQSLIFILEDSDTMVAQALGDMRFERVK